jgi:hypothetical protein
MASFWRSHAWKTLLLLPSPPPPCGSTRTVAARDGREAEEERQTGGGCGWPLSFSLLSFETTTFCRFRKYWLVVNANVLRRQIFKKRKI